MVRVKENRDRVPEEVRVYERPPRSAHPSRRPRETRAGRSCHRSPCSTVPLTVDDTPMGSLPGSHSLTGFPGRTGLGTPVDQPKGTVIGGSVRPHPEGLLESRDSGSGRVSSARRLQDVGLRRAETRGLGLHCNWNLPFSRGLTSLRPVSSFPLIESKSIRRGYRILLDGEADPSPPLEEKEFPCPTTLPPRFEIERSPRPKQPTVKSTHRNNNDRIQNLVFT